MMTDCFSPACSGSKALPSLTFCGMMTSQSVSNSMGVGWIYPLFEGYTQHADNNSRISYGWIYPLFEGYTQRYHFIYFLVSSWIYPLFEGYTQHDSWLVAWALECAVVWGFFLVGLFRYICRRTRCSPLRWICTGECFPFLWNDFVND